MKSINNILLLLFVLLLISVNGCNNYRVIHNNYFSMHIFPEWKLNEIDSLNYILRRDTVYLKISVHKETDLNTMLLRTPEEYIKTEDGNLLSKYAFADSNTIYTSNHYISYIEESILLDSLRKDYKVKENISPVVRRFLKVQDSTSNFEDIDYLCEFVYNNEIKWLPVKLPEYFKHFDFIVNTTSVYYKKIYYPIFSKKGKCGFIYYSFKNGYALIIQSSLVTGESPELEEIKGMINSVKILENKG